MAQQTIGVGTVANDGTGDPLRTALTKTNANFTDLYARAQFSAVVTDASPGTSANNYSPTSYAGGTTNRLKITAAAGGTTLTGLAAAVDGWQIIIRNMSTTDVINFSHLSGSSTSANQFSCPQGVTAVLQPLTATILLYDTNQWIFIS